MFESKKIGRALSVTAGLTTAYLINKVQKERMPADFLGYSLKTSACFFLGQRAIGNEDEFLVKALLGYWAYETLRLTPIGKASAQQPDVKMNQSDKPIAGYLPAPEDIGKEPIQNPMGMNGLGSLMTPENVQMAGVALKGLASLVGGFMNKGE